MKKCFYIITTHDGKELPCVLQAVARLHDLPSTVVVSSDGMIDGVEAKVLDFNKRTKIRSIYASRAARVGARRAQTRNNAVRALLPEIKANDTLVFIDGDIVVHPDHKKHIAALNGADVVLGYVLRLNPERSNCLRAALHKEGICFSATFSEHIPLLHYALKIRTQMLIAGIRDFTKLPLGRPWWPSLASGNFAVRYGAFQDVNGFNEEYIGWGLEDADLGRRLLNAKFRFRSAIISGAGFHLWHPSNQATPATVAQFSRSVDAKNGDGPCFSRYGLMSPFEQDASELLVQYF